MARLSFGGGPADYLENEFGRRVVGTVTLWTAASGGTRVTDLLIGAVAATDVVTDSFGYLPEFFGPDGVTKLYVDAGSGRRFVLETNDEVGASATVSDANATTKGVVQLAGALGGTAAAPTVPGLALKLDTSQKGAANGVAPLGADSKVPAANLPASASATDATSTVKGVVQLAGDLAGTSAAPTVPGLALKLNSSEKGAASGVAPLGADSRVPSVNLPAADSTIPRRLLHNGTSYPSRPAGVAAGMVDYVGPTEPTDWLVGDIWEQVPTSPTALLTDAFTGTDGAAWDAVKWQSLNAATILTNKGRLLVPATAFGSAYAYSVAATPTANLVFKARRPVTGNDGNISVWVCAQWTANALTGFNVEQPVSGYNVAFFYNTTTGGAINLSKRVSGAAKAFVSQIAYSPPRDADFWIRVQRTGTVVQVRAWLDGAAEPGTWLGSMTADPAIPDNGVISIAANNESVGSATVAVLVDDVTVTAA